MEQYDPGAFDSRGEKSFLSKKRKKDQISGCCKRGKMEQRPTCDHESSLTPRASCVTNLPVTYAVPLQYIQKI